MKTVAVKLSILLLGLLIGLGLLEGLIRWIAPHPRYAYTNAPHEKVGHVARPGFRGRATNMFGEFDTELRINQEGFRDRDYPIEKGPETLRIAFLGDSFTFAEQVQEPGTFVRRAETLLREKRHAQGKKGRIECMNFGVGGYEIQQYVLCYEEFVRKYHPEIVVVNVYVDNDLLGNAFYLLEDGFGRPYYRLSKGTLEKIPANAEQLNQNYRRLQNRLETHWYHALHLYNKQKLIFWKIRQEQRLREAKKRQLPLEKLWKEGGYRNYRYYAVGAEDPVVQEADALTRLLLLRLKELVEQDGGRFYLSLLPAPENLWPERWPERRKLLPGLEKVDMDFERPYRMIQSFLPEMEARGDLMDARPFLRKAAEKAPIFFPRDSHYNSNGQEAVAQALALFLESRIELKLGD